MSAAPRRGLSPLDRRNHAIDQRRDRTDLAAPKSGVTCHRADVDDPGPPGGSALLH